jgi:L-aspartate oxidase
MLHALVEQAYKQQIKMYVEWFVCRLIVEDGACKGVVAYNMTKGGFEEFRGEAVIMATGGAGRTYSNTSNAVISTGGGAAMAYQAGVPLQDLEFVQFHPTTLYLAGADRFLITEAVRGEGGVLRDGAGSSFMRRFHPLADLAPRDVVSRGIMTVLKERGESRVSLDLSAIPPERIRARFPRILEILQGFGIDILKDPIPVRPSAHYTIGGVKTDLQARTSLPGLYAAGEVASTGLHGANRLASNSLLEGLVFGRRAGQTAAVEAPSVHLPEPTSVDHSRPRSEPRPPALDLSDLTSSLKSLLWQKVGLERRGPELRSTLDQIQSWIPYVLGTDFHEVESWIVQNMLLTAYLITFSAMRRKESRGVHFRVDFPEKNDAEWCRHLTLSRNDITVP